jgi:4-amino-4-deoxy-L-arabinose transferase-like glycosyltransferase
MHVLGPDTPARLAAARIGVGAASAPLPYGLARELFDDRTARLAGLLMALAPQALLMGVTTGDAVYLTIGLIAAWPLARARTGSDPGLARVLGAVLLAVASLFAWSLLAIGAWAAILAWSREGLRSAIELSAICGVVLLAFHGAFAALTGFDPIGTVRATEDVYRLGVASIRPYWYWLFGSPVGFLLVLGLPISWLALRELARGTPEAVAIFSVLAIAAVMGFTKAETERIWLFFAPFVCLAAARALARRPELLVPVAAALAAQALLHEALSDTVW